MDGHQCDNPQRQIERRCIEEPRRSEAVHADQYHDRCGGEEDKLRSVEAEDDALPGPVRKSDRACRVGRGVGCAAHEGLSELDDTGNRLGAVAGCEAGAEVTRVGYQGGACEAYLTGGETDKPSFGVVLHLADAESCLAELAADHDLDE